jgi:hypothetical protein
MSETSRGSVYRALDYVGFSCILVGVEEYGRSFAQVGQTMPWRVRVGFIVVGVVLLWLGEQGANTYKTLRELFRAPAELKRALARNAELEARLRSQGPARQGADYHTLRNEYERLKGALSEQQRTIDAHAEVLVENDRLKQLVSQMRSLSATLKFPAIELEPDSTLPTKLEDRIFVNESPSFLLRFFGDSRTAMQAQGLIQPYLNKWMKLPNTQISDVEARSGGGCSITGKTPDGAMVMLHFAKDWAERISILRRGNTISVIGMIDSVRPNFVGYGKCEIVAE